MSIKLLNPNENHSHLSPVARLNCSIFVQFAIFLLLLPPYPIINLTHQMDLLMAAKDFPTYVNQHPSVAPVQPVASFHTVAQGENALGAIATSVFNESSMQLAAINGQKAAEQGLPAPFPALTGADKEYVGAYKQTAFENAYTQGNRLFKNLALTASSDPEGANVQVLKDSIGQFIQGLQAKLPTDVYKKLQQSWAPQLDSEYYSLLQESSAKNAKDLRIQGAEYAQTEAKTTFDLAAEGNFEGAKESAARLAERGGDFPQQAVKMYEDGVKVNAVQKALAQGDTEKVSELVGSNPDLISYVNQFEANKRSHEATNYIKAQTALKLGQPLGTVLASYNLTAEHVERIKLKDASRASSESKKAARVAAFFATMQNGNIGKLTSEFTDADTNNAYDSILSNLGNDSLESATTVAANFPIPIKKFQERLSGSLNYGDPEELHQASAAVQSLSNLNPVALSGMSSADLATAFTYNNLAQDTTKPLDKIAEEARKSASGLTLQEQQQRQAAFQAALKGNPKYTDPIKQANTLSKQLGRHFFSSNASVPGSLVEAYGNLITANSQYTDKPAIASDMAIAELAQVYKETNVNGKNELQAYPATSVLPDIGNYQVNAKHQALGNVAARNAEARAKGDITYMSIEYPDAPRFENVQELIEGTGGKKSYTANIPVIGDVREQVSERTNKVTDTVIINGRKAQLYVGSDDRTKATQGASWPLSYVNEQGIVLPILDVDGSQARWYADTRAIDVYNSLDNESKAAINRRKVDIRRTQREYDQANPSTPIPFGNIQ